MTTEIDNNENEPEEYEGDDTLESAGEILKAERERLGYSEKQVADRLHITMHYVRAIETDCYEKLPGTVFARGYIRSYAELLDLDSEQLVAMFNTRVGEQARHARQEGLDRKRRNARSKAVPWLVLALLAFGGGFLVFWAYNVFLSSDESDLTDIGYTEIQVPMFEQLGSFSAAQSHGPVPDFAGGTDVVGTRFIGQEYLLDVNSQIEHTASPPVSI